MEDKMTVQGLYDHITKHMSAEEALKKLLEGTVMTYDKLKFEDGEAIHPAILISIAAYEMGWGLAISNNDDDIIVGMVTGTEEYINSVLPEDTGCGCDCGEGCGGCGC